MIPEVIPSSSVIHVSTAQTSVFYLYILKKKVRHSAMIKLQLSFTGKNLISCLANSITTNNARNLRKERGRVESEGHRRTCPSAEG